VSRGKASEELELFLMSSICGLFTASIVGLGSNLEFDSFVELSIATCEYPYVET